MALPAANHVWTFDNDLTDQVGNLDVTANGAINTALNPHLFTNSLLIDGVDDNPLSDDTGLPTGNSARTFMFWFYPYVIDDIGVVFDVGEDAILSYGQNFVMSYGVDGIGSFAIDLNGHRWGTASNLVTINSWNLGIATVPNGATNTDDILLDLNGLSVTTSTLAGSVRTLNTILDGHLHFGTNGAGFGEKVQMGQCGIWDSELSAAQRLEAWNGGAGVLFIGPEITPDAVNAKVSTVNPTILFGPFDVPSVRRQFILESKRRQMILDSERRVFKRPSRRKEFEV